MSEPPSSSKPDPTDKDRALAALHNLVKPKPRADATPSPPANDGPLSGASGFVGMLAKKTLQDSEGIDSLKEAEVHARRQKYQLPMATEIDPNKPPSPPVVVESPAVVPALPPQKAAVPRGRVLTLLMLLMAAILLAIGSWAAGALYYMHNVHPIAPADVHYPLLRWEYNNNPDLPDLGMYTPLSRTMAISMLLCLPVSLLLAVLGILLLRRR